MDTVKPFPFTTAHLLALEYAKARLTPETTPEQFARLYLDALQRIQPVVQGR